MSETVAVTVTLTEFLSARLDEDEAAVDANGSTFGSPAHWDDPYPTRMDYDQMVSGPNRWLAEVAAKRRIARSASLPYACVIHGGTSDPLCIECVTCHDRLRQGERTVRILAAIYADHADYDEAWRP